MKPKVLFLQRAPKETKPVASIYGLAMLVTIAMAIALYIISDLAPEDKLSVGRGASLFFTGSFFFTSLYNFFVHLTQKTAAGQRLIKRYRLNAGDVLDISNKIVSSIQAMLSCAAGFVSCTYSCPRNLLRTSHHVSQAYAWFGASYFFYDIWSMYRVHMNTPPGQINTPSAQLSTPIPPPKSEECPSCELAKFARYVRLNPIIVGHHIFIGMFGFSVMIYFRGTLGDCVFGFVYLMEASTPFVSFRGVLSRFQMKSTKLYIYNGFAMLLVFFLCRIVMFPYVVHLYAKAASLSYFMAIYSLPTGCKVSISILLFPQLYWFYLMVKGATKILRVPKTPCGGSPRGEEGAELLTS